MGEYLMVYAQSTAKSHYQDEKNATTSKILIHCLGNNPLLGIGEYLGHMQAE